MTKGKGPELLGFVDAYGEVKTTFIWGLGISLFFLGILIVVVAWFLDPSIETPGAYGISTRVVNIGKSQIQLMVFLSGCFTMLSGAVLWAGGTVYGIIQQAANRWINDSFAAEHQTTET